MNLEYLAGCLIVIGFLEDREMEVFYKGVKSERKKLPGGGPQGTILGMFLFLILINGAGFKNLERNTGKIICNPALGRRNPIDRLHLKWVDDMTAAEAINLKGSLMTELNPVHPLQFHERTGHKLPSDQSKLQGFLNDLLVYTKEHEMRINETKTNVILFNRAKMYDFLPKLTVGQSTVLNVVKEAKILGVKIQDNLKWNSNTSFICGKAYARLWVLRRLKPLGVTRSVLLEVYEKQVRCVVEYASPVWSGGLTKAECYQIERVQKTAFALILGNQYNSYEHALHLLQRDSLETRRKVINLKFARKCADSPKFSHWFSSQTKSSHNMMTRSQNHKSFVPVQSRTKVFANSHHI